MNFKYFFIIVVFLQAALTWLKAGIVTTHPEHENHELVIAKDESVVFEITPDSGDVITALIVTPSGPETTGTGSPLTATFQAGTEGQVYTCTLTVTHTDGDETCTAGKDFIYKVYVPVITLVNVDNLDTKSTYVKYEDTLDSIVSVKGSGDVQLKATVLPDAQKVKSLLSWTGATVDQNDKTKAKKSRTTSERADVSVSLTGHPDIKRDAKLWIAWVTLSFDNTGPKPDDSSVAPPTFGASSGARNGCLIQGTITPSGLGDKSEGFGVKYDLRRTIQAMTWYRADGLLASWIP
ncbi:MAG: hypothetical protein M0Q93_12825, partial [Terrimicrobiaceae bacterium]|nr:hypothetical protein [Terrimicrobiaceae bacterium]